MLGKIDLDDAVMKMLSLLKFKPMNRSEHFVYPCCSTLLGKPLLLVIVHDLHVDDELMKRFVFVER